MSNKEATPTQAYEPPRRRAEVLSRALADAARRFRMSKRSRRAAGIGSLRSRRYAHAFRVLFVASFVALVVIPSLAAAIYYGLIASPVYVAETKFAVRTGEVPKLDGLGAAIGLPAAKIAQDTQVVANFMQSRTLVEQLEQRIGLRSMYSANDIDWVARFGRDHSTEKLVKYWKSMSRASIQVPSGIVTFSVRAFSPEDALRIAETVIELSESLVNDMNNRMLQATVADAEREFARSAERLSRARAEYQRVRNAEGMIDAGQAGKALADLITLLQGERLRLQQEYDTQSKSVAPTAPQMRSMAARLSALADQIADLEAKLTSQRTGAATDRVLSESLTKFAQQDLERRIAERQYAAAASALELARATSTRQLVYLAAFVRPALPQEAEYPRRLLYTGFVIAGGLALWALLCGAATAVRNHMA